MEAGAAVWVKDEAVGWVAGSITERINEGETSRLTVAIDDENVGEGELIRELCVSALETETDDVKRRDPTALGVSDLISLPILHEPAIVHALELRYVGGSIYTFNGSILIAVNPFQRLQLYTTEILETYYNNGLLRSQGIDSAPMEPHVYTIADAAYRDMANAISASGAKNTKDASQSILISGESGAGKTETTKIVMRYLTVVGGGREGSKEQGGDKATIMERVLQSNPILEAFGNARTVRNDNSSRFGKFIELKFDDRGAMRGAAIDTYLLEKIRLPTHALGERNFHVFYQLHATVGNVKAREAAAALKTDWALETEAPAKFYHYANQGGIAELQSMDDGQEFCAMTTALETLGFSESHRRSALSLVASLLHLGQVTFEYDAGDDGGGSKCDEESTRELNTAARLAALPPDALLKALTSRHVKTRSEEYVVRLVPDDAASARDAVAKALYGRLFEWLVERINAGIAVVENENASSAASIGVLDIFGFECFASNSFEQLCINYTNETLQQQFNRYVFKLEQEEYAREAITWSFIEFPDNQDCLDLIEGSRKQMPPDGGLLLMLDDECRLPKGSDGNYAARVSKSLGTRSRLGVSRKQAVDGVFEVRHYAGPVPYKVHGFLEKNKDELPRDAEHLFAEAAQSDPSSLLAEICSAFERAVRRQTLDKQQQHGGSGEKEKQAQVKSVTVGSQFKAQLSRLMRTVSATKPHYVRCLKPNDKNAPNLFERVRVAEQLRYGGVLEAVRVARSGFPVRLAHADFLSHYGALGPSLSKADKKKACSALAETAAEGAGFATEQIQLGKTKVFLRKTAHDQLEARRTLARRAAATKLGALVRMLNARGSSRRQRLAGLVLKKFARSTVAAARLTRLREFRASTIIAGTARRKHEEARYCKARAGALALEAVWRGQRARQDAFGLRRAKAATRIGAAARSGRCQLRKRSVVKAVTAFQAAVRRNMARKALSRLRQSARDVGRLKKEQEAMKDEIALLRSQAAEASRRRDQEQAAESRTEVLMLRAQLEKEKKQYAEDLKLAKRNYDDKLLETRNAAETQLATLKHKLADQQETADVNLKAAKQDIMAQGQQLQIQTANPTSASSSAAKPASASSSPRAVSSPSHQKQQDEASAEESVEALRRGVQVTSVTEDGLAVGEPMTLMLARVDKDGNEEEGTAPLSKSTAALTFTPRSRSLFKRTKPPAPLRCRDVGSVRAAASDPRCLVVGVLRAATEDRREVVLHFASEQARQENQRALCLLCELPDEPVTTYATTLQSSPPKEAAPLVQLDNDAVAELEKQLLLERANNQKMMLQMLEMQNDVNRSSAKIVELKQESAGLRSQLVARDRMHADDARMRLQLGKRLQQLVFDNAALRRSNDELQAQVLKRF